ncbi:MAG: hypothetical protein ACYC6N_24490 [Pirellulaceae bacterium]
MRKWIAAVIALFSPVLPWHWWSFARRLSIAHGWMPTMLLWAVLGIFLSLNFGIGRQQNIPWLERFNWLGLLTWTIVATLAMIISVTQSAFAIWRMGVFGFRRPRWWFELARTSWNFATIAIVGVLLGFFMNNQQRLLLEPLFSVLFSTFRIMAPAFFLFATMGYLLSFASQLPRCGRAYDCVHYFYATCGSLGIITYAAILCPPNPAIHIMIGCAVLGTIGLLWFVLGFISIVRRLDAWERRQCATEQDDAREWPIVSNRIDDRSAAKA